MSFTGKSIAVTGATGGMGLVLSKHLADQGASLSLADLNASALDRLAKSLLESRPAGSTALYTTYTINVTASPEVDAWISGRADSTDEPTVL